MQETNHNKSTIRRQLRETLAQMTEPTRHAKSAAACALIVASPEFAAARERCRELSNLTRCAERARRDLGAGRERADRT